jgi:hypothetical protein
MRYTSGGRLEFSSYSWYLTLSGYYQYGKDSSGKSLAAYYLQPEVRYTGIKNVTFRLGMEYLSGQDTMSSKDNSFVTLYGTAHRFMGNLDYFGTFPRDVNNGGLINPYLFLMYKNNKVTLRCESHLFYAQSNAAFKGKENLPKYLGFENDWRINYKPIPVVDVESGFCWAAGDTKAFPYFFYLSLRFTPTLLKFSF